jgi:hypothetical protein
MQERDARYRVGIIEKLSTLIGLHIAVDINSIFLFAYFLPEKRR